MNVLDRLATFVKEDELVDVYFNAGLKNTGRITEILEDGFILESQDYPAALVLIDSVTRLSKYVPPKNYEDKVEMVGAAKPFTRLPLKRVTRDIEY